MGAPKTEATVRQQRPSPQALRGAILPDLIITIPPVVHELIDGIASNNATKRTERRARAARLISCHVFLIEEGLLHTQNFLNTGQRSLGPWLND
jgi:hypothetical protein